LDSREKQERSIEIEAQEKRGDLARLLSQKRQNLSEILQPQNFFFG